MATSKQWYTSANLALADSSTANRCAHSTLWGFGAMLLGNQSGTNGPEGARPGSCYWVLAGSSNSTTSGIDATDRLNFAGAFTDANWVRANAGTAHTWFVLQSPAAVLDGPWYLCIDYIGPSNDQTCTVVISKQVFSGGSTTARPTSTGECVYNSLQFCSTTLGAGKLHLNIDANGNFRFLRSRNGTGYFDLYFSLESLVETHTGDAARAFSWVAFTDSGRGALTTANSLALMGMARNGTTALTTAVAGVTYLISSPAGNRMDSFTAPNATDSTVDALPTAYVHDNTAANKGIRGRFPDMWEIGTQVAVGSTFPSVGNVERAAVGGWMIAMSVAPAL